MLNEEQIKTEPTVEKVVFKKKAKKNLRQRRNSDDEEVVPEHVVLDEIRERQRLRQRPAGVSLVGLALGKKLTLDEEVIGAPLDVKSGGLLNMQSLRSGKLKQVDDTYDVSIGTQFSAETNKRDEDEEMMKYIEAELQKRKGLISAENEGAETEASQKYLTPEEAALQALPEHLRQSSSNRSEEMLSNQMLNGIPEVDLGIDAKIKNIEATEEAKLKLIREQQNKNDGPSHFVPTNMAVNFMQHNRFKIDDNNSEQKKRQYQNRSGQDQQGQQQNQQGGGGAGQKGGGGGGGVKRATDDYHYDKFKKQFRRY